MARVIKAYIVAANRATRSLHLQRCPRCLKSDVLALDVYADGFVYCQECPYKHPNTQIEIVRSRASW